MDLLSPKIIKELLEKYSAKPSKLMGQNFLVDANALAKVVEAAQLNAQDTVLEVGPGMGILTRQLAKTVKKVIAIEKDRAMVEILKETLRDFNNVEIIQGDALKIKSQIPMTNDQSSPKSQFTDKYKVVANIPYYLTSPLIRKFLEEKTPPSAIVLMIQKEVAQRIVARPPHMSILAVSVQFYATAKIISYVSKNCFWPAPKVDSAVINIIPFENKQSVDANTFFAVVKAGFSHPRKQLANNLSGALNISRDKINTWLMENNLQSTQRAETLGVQDWINLTTSRPATLDKGA